MSAFKVALGRLGFELDARAGRAAHEVHDDSLRRLPWAPRSVEPTLAVRLPGMVTIHKPADWEVDGAASEPGEHLPLSSYLQSLFRRSECPLVWDTGQSYGFLHRLDIPSSGLVLCGTSFQGYYALRLQLDTHRLRREYLVLGHNMAPSGLTEIVARVDVAPDPSQRKSISDSGRPSQTMLVVSAHVRQRQAGLPEPGGNMFITAIRIATGRRHQIRAHMRHAGHPSIADARYTCREVRVAADRDSQNSSSNAAAKQSNLQSNYNNSSSCSHDLHTSFCDVGLFSTEVLRVCY
ncbi:unnamed protein product [Polarella glacialis]|uniref:Pseudouridine synthase RsuA/RluA-like domain-containing protein n=1 Tax=Polarella glacialis TaxID=89957 RepID=A0A813KBP8_POLGL|nr:unnamed protein product [Polarella glacialis]